MSGVEVTQAELMETQKYGGDAATQPGTPANNTAIYKSDLDKGGRSRICNIVIAIVAALVLLVLTYGIVFSAVKEALFKQHIIERDMERTAVKEQQEREEAAFVCTAADIFAKGMETSYENYSKYIHNDLNPCLEYLKATGEFDKKGAYLWQGKEPDWYAGDVNDKGEAHGYGKVFVPDENYSGVGTLLFGKIHGLAHLTTLDGNTDYIAEFRAGTLYGKVVIYSPD